MRWARVMAVVAVVGGATVWLMHTSVGVETGAASDIMFFDPDANYDAVPRIIKGLNEHLAQQLPGIHLQAVDDVAALVSAVATHRPSYALIASDSLDAIKKFGVTPLLVPMAAGTVYYHKILVDTGTGKAGDLAHKRIAAATGEQGQVANNAVLSTLRTAGLKVDGAALIATSKDFDALLGMTFGQADAALVTSDSIEVLKSVNPGAAAGLRVVWTSGKILRPLLVQLKHDAGGPTKEDVLRAFSDMAQTAPGKVAMKSLGFERWIPFSPDLVEKGI